MSYSSNGDRVGGSRTRYLPFGGYRTAPSQTYTDRGYTGQKHNDDLGLIYFNARYYLPGIGRFVSADTIVPDVTNPQSFNRYSYVLGNPLRYSDPTGHVWYDPGLDAAMPGNCNGGSTPLREPPSQEQEPTRPLIRLAEWEIQLLILVAINEGGAQSSQQVEYITQRSLKIYAKSQFARLRLMMVIPKQCKLR
ncbi:MAG: hypothetical protein H6650_05715 [Ardenticatenales bacterium]|nr:hypothetical protein [Ardenticatenales bacterium]